MFLLFLCLGAASVKAQVRIGGNAAPNGGAMLDLNATDATNNGTKGLALPRVNLTSNTMQLTSGVVNLTGMLVYNTTATLGRIGIYYWNGANWILTSLPSTSATDSGMFLTSLGNTVGWRALILGNTVYPDTLHLSQNPVAVTWTKVLDTSITITVPARNILIIQVPGIQYNDFCMPNNNAGRTLAWATSNRVELRPTDSPQTNMPIRFRCYRPSL